MLYGFIQSGSGRRRALRTRDDRVRAAYIMREGRRIVSTMPVSPRTKRRLVRLFVQDWVELHKLCLDPRW